MTKKKLALVLLAFIFTFTFVDPVLPQESGTAMPTKPAVTPEPTQAAALEEEADETAPGNVTMDFKNADINNVLRILSYKSGVNIVAGPEVEGLVTIRLSDVPWEKALDVVLRTYGFAYERVGNIIRVTTIESLKQEELTTEVFALSYGEAEDVSEAIDNMLTERGKTKYDERTNTLVVTDVPTNLYKISRVVKKLDRRTPQVMIEAKIVETTLADDERLGIDWSLQASLQGSSKPTTFPFSRRAGTNAEEYVDRFFGAGSAAAPVVQAGANAATVGAGAADFPGWMATEVSSFPFAPTDSFNFGTLDLTTFRMTMEYLKTRADTEVLSNPRVTTLNNQQSSILVGQIIGIPTYERNTDTGSMEITGYEEKEVGVLLTVTPHINVEGDISVDLKPEISELLRYDTLDAARGIVAPVFSTRVAETQVMIRDGETIMIGGLIKKTVSDRENKVPLLGDIPLIGKALFTKIEEDIDRTELIIFLTVHLVQEQWVPPAGFDPKLVEMPKTKDKEINSLVPGKALVERKKKAWWQWW